MKNNEDNDAERIITPKKSLGQNFLTSKRALCDIVDVSGAGKGSTVLEIGPGKGALTRKLLETGATVVGLEKDDRLIPWLNEAFSEEIAAGKLKIIHADALEFEPGDAPSLKGGYIIVANIPYYITGAFLRKFLGAARKPESMTLLVQKEVAERIVARDGKESVLSVSVKVYGRPSYISTVKAGSFFPAPSVDSAIIHIGGISADLFDGFSEEAFFATVKAGFASKRKQLRGNLSKAFGAERAERALRECGISEKSRAEDLAIRDWANLAHTLESA